MDNITHTFVGAAIGQCALGPQATAVTRRVFVATAALAANAPDLDLLYTGVTEEPIGYLLHHRGHSHTLPGLVALTGLMWIGLRLWPAAKSLGAEVRTRLALVIAAALASHLLMDAANSYGTHLFYPFSSRWFFGDAVFIFEPWTWLLLGTALAMNAPGPWLKVLVALSAIVPIVALTFLDLASAGLMLTLLGAGVGGAILMRRTAPRARSAIALTALTVLFVLLFGLSRVAGGQIRRFVASRGGDVVDVVVNANPGLPWCWVVLALEHERGAGPDELVARRGTLSLLPGAWPAASCTTARIAARDGAGVGAATAEIRWHREWRIDVAAIRTLERTDWRVRAWLQFGRVPYLTGNRIADLRFESSIGGGFGSMTIDRPSSGCPRNLTDWELPRQDVLGR